MLSLIFQDLAERDSNFHGISTQNFQIFAPFSVC